MTKVYKLSYGVHLKLDLSACNISQLQDVINVVIEKGLVVLKNQRITVERFNEINEIWGIHQPANIWANHKKFPNIYRVTNKEVQKGRKGLFSGQMLDWHNDGGFSPDPEEYICLWCIDPGESGGTTSFACGQHAYNILDESIKAEIEHASLFMTNENAKTYMKGGPYDSLLSYEQEGLDKYSSRTRNFSGGADNNPYNKNISYITTTNPHISKKRKKRIIRPLVKKHPYSEKKGLYFFQIYGVSEIRGILNPSRSKDIFDILVQSYVGSFGKFYEHQWEVGDLILSDQIHGLHRRRPYRGIRELYKTAFWLKT